MANVGYIRVSSSDQKADRQLSGLELDRVFEDRLTGSNMDRPGWKECERYLREGDTLYVHSIDRLARNLQDLLSTVQSLIENGVTVVFHSENLKFSGEKDSNPMQLLQLHMLGAVAQFERTLIRARQRDGIEKAKARGVHLGRANVLDKEEAEALREKAKAGMTKSALAKAFGISRATVYRYLSLN